MTSVGQRPVAVLLSPVVPQPGGSGRALRAWDWLQELAASHEVHVWCAAPAPAPPPAWPAGVRLWRASADLLPVSPGLRRLGWLLPGLCGRWPRAAAHWQAPAGQAPTLAAMAAAIGRPVARLVVFRLYLHGVAERLCRLLPVQRRELDLDDWDAATLASVACAQRRMGQRLEACLTAREALQYRALEARVPARYDAVWLAAPEDLPAFARAGLRPNRLRPVAPAGLALDAGQLLFVGSLDYPPNQEAALFLAERLAPVLRAAPGAPPWSLTIAGSRAPAWLRARLRPAPVQLLADAADLAPVYAASSLVLLPLFAGGGTKFKTLEALAHGRAVVASREAVRGLGLGLVAGRHYLPAETAAEFAEAVLRLLRSPAQRQALAEAAHAWSRACAGACA